MTALKRFFHPRYLLLIIVVLVLFNSSKWFSSEPPQAGNVTTLLEKMDGVIGSLEHGSVQSESAITQRAGDSPGQTEPPRLETHSVQQGGEDKTAASFSAYSSGKGIEEKERVTASSDIPSIAASLKPGNAGNGTTASETKAGIGELTSGTVTSQEVVGPQTSVSSNTATTKVMFDQILQTWNQARISAWQGNFVAAIEQYRTIVKMQPDNFDAYGEMGNVMLLIGDREGAADAYYQAARLINKAGQSMVAWNLLHAIAELDPHKADRLYDELMGRSPS